MSPAYKYNLTAWVFSVLLAVFFILSGSALISGTQTQSEYLTAMGIPLWLRYPAGLAELLFALGLLLPGFRLWTAVLIILWAVAVFFLMIKTGTVQFTVTLAVLAVAVLDVLLIRTLFLKKQMKSADEISQ